LPNNNEISRYLETMNFYNFQYSKFFLSLIEEHLTKNRPDQNDKNLQIEHIMPQKLNGDWETELGDDYESVHQELVNTIGNLALIRHNQELGNKKFSEKKKIYEDKAGLRIATKEITNQARWTSESIRHRTQWMIEFLLDNVLAISDKRRKANNFSSKSTSRSRRSYKNLIGKDIVFIDDPSIRARVVSDREVEFEGKKWKLSPLTKEIQTRKGKVNRSGAYQGGQYWMYNGVKLVDIE